MTLSANVVSIAKAQVGYREGYSGGHWNNIEKYAGQVPGLEWANGQPWCAVFVSWVAMKAGAASLYPRTASVAAAAAWWKNAGRWSEYPAIGAQVIFGGGAHTGIVVAFDATNITTVEGNTNTDGSAEGNGVYLKVRARRDPWVTGYGYPKFPEGIQSADPAYRQPAPAKDLDMALLADLEAARKKHSVTRVYAARILLRAALTPAGALRRVKIRAALAAAPKE